MRTISDLASSGPHARRLLVLLPGVNMTAADFRTHGFFDAVRRSGAPIDIIAVDTGMEAYLDDRIVALLHEEIIAPACRSGPVKIWLAGISLGGMGALLYAQAHRERIAGLVLLAPFIGTRGLIAEAEAAGGLRQWRKTSRDDATTERKLLTWLAQYDDADRSWPDMRLAYGIDDRFAGAYRLLADIMPRHRVLTSRGGHDWPTWTGLWQELLRTAPFAASPEEHLHATGE
jgi:pimeloyl-ACP methyl ester carboxylesterase